MSEFTAPTKELITLPRSSRSSSSEPMQWMTVPQVRQGPGGLTWRDFVLVGGAIVLVAVVGLLYLLQAAEITRIAYRTNDIKAALDRMEQENSVLQVEIAELERLDRIQERAAALGLERAQQVEFIRFGEDQRVWENAPESSLEATAQPQ